LRFIIDECTGPAVAEWLRSEGHDVFSVFNEALGADDDWIIAKAFAEDRILITNDKDFGDKVFRSGIPHHGIVFLRLENESATVKIETLRQLLDHFSNKLADQFVVVTESSIRFARA
jgi:predicted nuclease of predicted toxin-antitoxin system